MRWSGRGSRAGSEPGRRAVRKLMCVASRGTGKAASAARRRFIVACVLALFALVQMGSWAHRALIEHAACEVHQELCHIEPATGVAASDAARPSAPRQHAPAPGDDDEEEEEHGCTWRTCFRTSADVTVDSPPACGSSLAVAQLPPAAPLQAPRTREGLHLLAPKGSPPVQSC